MFGPKIGQLGPFTSIGVSFSVSRRTKMEFREIHYPAFSYNPKLCPVSCLKAYKLCTSSFCAHHLSGLFVSFRALHCPVSSSTVARKVRWTMAEVGVDTSVFGAHSTRSTSATSVVIHGGPLVDLLRTATWSHESTFRQFYLHSAPHVFLMMVVQL